MSFRKHIKLKWKQNWGCNCTRTTAVEVVKIICSFLCSWLYLEMQLRLVLQMSWFLSASVSTTVLSFPSPTTMSLCNCFDFTKAWLSFHTSFFRIILSTASIRRDWTWKSYTLARLNAEPQRPKVLLQLNTNGPWWKGGTHFSHSVSILARVYMSRPWKRKAIPEVKNRRNSPFADERMHQRREGSVGESDSDNSAKSCNLAWYYTQHLPPPSRPPPFSLCLQSRIHHSQIILWYMKEHRILSSSCQTETRLSEEPSFSFGALKAGIAGSLSHLPDCDVVKSRDALNRFRLEANKGAARVTLRMWDSSAILGVNMG